MQTVTSPIQALSDLINHAHSPFHCSSYCMEKLKAEGFHELYLNQPFQLSPGGKYVINLYDASCMAFTIGKSVLSSGLPTLRMLTSHTDWPTFLVKPQPESVCEQYGRLNVEPYGGAIYTSWLDRPLGLAGKVCIKGNDPFHPQTLLVDSKSSVAVIPGLAIHMNRETNDGTKLNLQLHMLPLVSLGDQKDFFPAYLAGLAKCSPEDILDYEICLYNADEGCETGFSEEFFSSPRIDNCSGVQAALDAVINSDIEGDLICVSAFYHNEEIGSTTKQGADSALTRQLFERIFENLGLKKEELYCVLAEGLCLSLDVAHGMHPAYPDKNDPTNHVCLGDGVAIKLSARQSYATDASYVSIIQALCEEHHIPYSKYVNRSDIRGGSTLGSISSAKLGIPCVDAGVPLLSMHSARELMACSDQTALCRLAKAVFQNS